MPAGQGAQGSGSYQGAAAQPLATASQYLAAGCEINWRLDQLSIWGLNVVMRVNDPLGPMRLCSASKRLGKMIAP